MRNIASTTCCFFNLAGCKSKEGGACDAVTLVGCDSHVHSPRHALTCALTPLWQNVHLASEQRCWPVLVCALGPEGEGAWWRRGKEKPSHFPVSDRGCAGIPVDSVTDPAPPLPPRHPGYKSSK
ncbi:unnamed protein product [Protopolystoma xenopodis]|uniref:Uncharacterized protein n=1 Tax=Protopolystoma xenopodis TaxID=117903 RepID=A0A3S5ASJ4_9PLAT|nr:unnamed protein product [Protopolystoma xenopodis]